LFAALRLFCSAWEGGSDTGFARVRTRYHEQIESVKQRVQLGPDAVSARLARPHVLQDPQRAVLQALSSQVDIELSWTDSLRPSSAAIGVYSCRAIEWRVPARVLARFYCRPGRLSGKSRWEYEQASVLFNLAVLHANAGRLQDLSTAEGIRAAKAAFEVSAPRVAA
jgi:hypothetical protein